MNNFDIIFLTNIPAFYKINLFNRIARKIELLALYTGRSPQQREKDFLSKKQEFTSLKFPSNLFIKIVILLKVLWANKYNRLVIGGWDEMIYWIALFLSPKRKNETIIESSIYESKTTGIHRFLKRLFLSRISRCYVPGEGNARLLKVLGYTGEIVLTRGVGIFNISPQPKFTPLYNPITRFLYVGRLSPEKNLHKLISVFNKLPNLHLTLVGSGPEEIELKKISNLNIEFIGSVDNSSLPEIYRNHHVFILPSVSETWGLVVEEALNNGLPILGSECLGCADTWLTNRRFGLTFNPHEEESMVHAIKEISSPDTYNEFRFNIAKLDFESIADHQVKSYLN